MSAPDIQSSTVEERREYVREAWKCMANCEICGKCSILKGREAEAVYEDYIEGRRSYVEESMELRDQGLVG